MTPRLVNQKAAEQRLGLAPRTLGRLAGVNPLYAPAVRGVPGADGQAGGHRFGRRFVRYHARQLELIEAVLVGGLPLDEAATAWAVARRRIGSPPEPRRVTR